MEEVIKAFYNAFENKDAKTMVAYYHENIRFTNPVFGTQKGDRAKNMWRMVCKNAKKLSVKSSEIVMEADKGRVHWEAQYLFSQTERKVHNKIDAQFKFKEGKIVEHIDVFNLHSWARQALGFKGFLIGDTSFFKRKLQQQTNRMLTKFESNQSNG